MRLAYVALVLLPMTGCSDDPRHPMTYKASDEMEHRQVGILCMHIAAKEGIETIRADKDLRFACMDYLGDR